MSKQLSAAIHNIGLKDVMSISELGLTVSGKCTSGGMCREIMEKFPEYADYSINCIRDGKLSYSIRNVSAMANKFVAERETGIVMQKWRPFQLR